MKKRLLICLILICNLMIFQGINAIAADNEWKKQVNETVVENTLTYGLIRNPYYGSLYLVLECNKSATGKVAIANEINNIPVTGILDDAFLNCDKITSIVLPDQLEVDSGRLFKGCTSLEQVIANENSLNYYNAGNVLYTKPSAKSGGETLVFYCSAGQSEKVFTLPNTCDNISDGAFAYAKNLKAINIYREKNGTLGYWGENAFGYDEILPIKIFGREDSDIEYFANSAGLSYAVGEALPEQFLTQSDTSNEHLYDEWISYPSGEKYQVNAVAKQTSSQIFINGKQVDFEAYNINDNNYFKLRDIAYALMGTEKQFDVSWEHESIMLKPNQAYTIVGGEMESKGLDTVNAKLSHNISLGHEVGYGNDETLFRGIYNIADNNYFKLRDVGKYFDFDVSWDGVNNAVLIDTTKGYTND